MRIVTVILLVLVFCLHSTFGWAAQILPKNYALPLEDALKPWLNSLHEPQRSKAESALQRFQPRIHDLQNQLRLKLAELKAVRFDQHYSPQTLPKLGSELQAIRRELNQLYTTLEAILQQLECAERSNPPRN